MNVHKSGSAVVSTFSLTTDEEPLIVESVRCRVLDEEGRVIADWLDLPGPFEAGAEELPITTSAYVNTLLPGLLRSIRVVQVRLTLPGGAVVEREAAHQIDATQLLVPGINSFQTYYQAVLGAQSYADETLTGWVGRPDEDARIRALCEAFERIRLLPVVIEWESDQSIIRDRYFDPPRLRDLTMDQVLRLEPRLMKALRQAQILEADTILADDPVERFRAAGVQSMTVGESSQYFGAAKPLDRGVGQGAAKVLARWLRHRHRIGRA
jgi:hypothetical protein